MGIPLFQHNQEAYEAALFMLSEKGKAAIIHPTGTGKSFIGFKLCEDFPASVIRWLSPSEYIFKTQMENLKSSANGWKTKIIRFFTYAKLMLMSEDEMKEIQPDFATYGNLDFTNTYVCDDGYPLGMWLANQRYNHRNHTKYSKLTAEQITRLESIGIVWKPSEEKNSRVMNTPKRIWGASTVKSGQVVVLPLTATRRAHDYTVNSAQHKTMELTRPNGKCSRRLV